MSFLPEEGRIYWKLCFFSGLLPVFFLGKPTQEWWDRSSLYVSPVVVMVVLSFSTPAVSKPPTTAQRRMPRKVAHSRRSMQAGCETAVHSMRSKGTIKGSYGKQGWLVQWTQPVLILALALIKHIIQESNDCKRNTHTARHCTMQWPHLHVSGGRGAEGVIQRNPTEQETEKQREKEREREREMERKIDR